jgi:hypothetical protein
MYLDIFTSQEVASMGKGMAVLQKRYVAYALRNLKYKNVATKLG